MLVDGVAVVGVGVGGVVDANAVVSYGGGVGVVAIVVVGGVAI